MFSIILKSPNIKLFFIDAQKIDRICTVLFFWDTSEKFECV